MASDCKPEVQYPCSRAAEACKSALVLPSEFGRRACCWTLEDRQHWRCSLHSYGCETLTSLRDECEASRSDVPYGDHCGDQTVGAGVEPGPANFEKRLDPPLEGFARGGGVIGEVRGEGDDYVADVGRDLRAVPDMTTLWQRVIRKTKFRFGSPLREITSLAQRQYDLQHALGSCGAPDREKRLIDRLQEVNDTLGQEFARLIGLTVSSDFVFEKKRFDLFMESFFGSLEREADLHAGYKGLTLVRDHLTEARVFSLYLLRKALPLAGPSMLAAAGDRFFDRMTNRTPRVEERDRLQRIRCERVFTAHCLAIVELVKRERRRAERKGGRKCFCQPANPASSAEVRGNLGFVKRAYRGLFQIDPLSDGGESKQGFDPTSSALLGKYVPSPSIVKPILSGGKIRVITLCTAFSAKLHSVMKEVAGIIRKSEWSVFGRSVDDWVRENSVRHAELVNPVWVSGDLESATDNFDGAFANEAIRIFSSLADDPDEFASIAYAITTEADLVVEDSNGDIVSRAYQSCGQLMASVVSFPVLCLISRVCAVTQDGVSTEALLGRFRESSSSFLESVNGEGINGDDVLMPENPYWESNVRACGGVVSRGKTLRNSRFGTINSELWDMSNSTRVPFVRPSELFSYARNFLDPFPRSAAAELARYMTLASGSTKTRINGLYKATVPKELGGLGLKVIWDAPATKVAFNIRCIPESKKSVVAKSCLFPQVEQDTVNCTGWVRKAEFRAGRNIVWYEGGSVRKVRAHRVVCTVPFTGAAAVKKFCRSLRSGLTWCVDSNCPEGTSRLAVGIPP